MSENTKIEWCDHTFNPWEGCQKLGPGCDHCYAETRNARFGSGVSVNWGPGAPRRRTSPANWRMPLKWNRQTQDTIEHWEESGAAMGGFKPPTRPKVFCASLADVFDNAVDEQWRAELLTLIMATPNLDWLLLTKRVGNVKEMLDRATWLTAKDRGDPFEWEPLPNVWIGATICNQEEADRDIPKLLAVPATKRFLSMEPLLGPVDLTSAYLPCPTSENGISMDPETGSYECCSHCDYTGISSEMGIDWVIVGGESGPNARPMHPDWARSLRNQCEAAGVPFLFKQWGEWAPHCAVAGGNEGRDIRRGHVRYLQGDAREQDGHFRRGDAAVAHVGKKAAGRLLDGREWNGAPA